MVDVIIPTMWRSRRLESMINIINENSNVKNIIIINNDNNAKNINTRLYKKVIEVIPHKNIYVNPAWNLGVRMATAEMVTIMNDDITYSMDYFDFICNNSIGILGVGRDCYLDDANGIIPPPKDIYIKRAEGHSFGWGCLISFKKTNWVPIPDNLKIFYGDNFMFDHNPTQCHTVHGLYVQTEMSTTSKSPFAVEIYKKEIEIYNKLN
jgi:hypothetical protein